MKKPVAKSLLNVSLVLHSVYAAVFLVLYVVQKPFWHLFVESDEIKQMSPIVAPAIVIVVAVTLGGSLGLNIALRSRAAAGVSANIGVLTAVFCVVGFLADRLTKAISCVLCTLAARMEGVDHVVVAGLHVNTLQLLDTFLLVFLAAGLALLPCAYCVIRFGAEENNFSKG